MKFGSEENPVFTSLLTDKLAGYIENEEVPTFSIIKWLKGEVCNPEKILLLKLEAYRNDVITFIKTQWKEIFYSDCDEEVANDIFDCYAMFAVYQVI